MTIAYLDASAIIYWLEGPAVGRAQVAQLVANVAADPGGRLITSQLARLECRVKPLRDGNAALLAMYDAFFQRSRLSVFDITATVLDRATEIRARHGFKVPDAIHLASAVEAGAETLLTGDTALKRFPGLRFEVIQP